MSFNDILMNEKGSRYLTNKNDRPFEKSKPVCNKADFSIYLLGPTVLFTTILLITKTTEFFTHELGSFKIGLLTSISLELFILSLSVIQEERLIGDILKKCLLGSLFLLSFGAIGYQSISPKLNDISNSKKNESQITKIEEQIKNTKSQIEYYKKIGWNKNVVLQTQKLTDLEKIILNTADQNTGSKASTWLSLALAILLRFCLQASNIYGGHRLGKFLFKK